MFLEQMSCTAIKESTDNTYFVSFANETFGANLKPFDIEVSSHGIVLFAQNNFKCRF